MSKTIVAVSVIVPIYNVEKYIERCARSLFEQTMDNIEYVFVNDNTQDDSIDILKNVLSDYPHRLNQVKIINHASNKGLPQARKTGILEANGDYIIHCDSDDWVNPNMYKNMYNTANKGGYDIVFSDYLITDGNTYKTDNAFKEFYSADKIQAVKQILNWKVSSSNCTKMVRRSLFTNDFIFPTENMWEDVPVNLQLLLRAKKYTHINQKYYYYYNNSASTCKTLTKEASIKRGYQIVKNTKIIDSIIRTSTIYSQVKSDLLLFKAKALESARLIMWVDYIKAFPSENIKIMFLRDISLKSKLSHMSKLVGLYSILKLLVG